MKKLIDCYYLSVNWAMPNLWNRQKNAKFKWLFNSVYFCRLLVFFSKQVNFWIRVTVVFCSAAFFCPEKFGTVHQTKLQGFPIVPFFQEYQAWLPWGSLGHPRAPFSELELLYMHLRLFKIKQNKQAGGSWPTELLACDP